MPIRPPLKGYGGKYLLRKWILDHFPAGYEEMVYVEPFAMGGSILLNKEPSRRELLSDIDPEVYAVWYCLRDRYEELRSRLKRLSFSEKTFLRYRDNYRPSSIVDAAVRRMALSRMSKNGLGKEFADCPRTRGGQQGDKNAWETFLTRELPKIHARIQGVDIRIADAIELIAQIAEDYRAPHRPRVLFYLDPPYLPETRTSPGMYPYDMTYQQHLALLEVVTDNPHCFFLISGYDSPLYRDVLAGWNVSYKESAMNVARGKQKRKKVEMLWYNYQQTVSPLVCPQRVAEVEEAPLPPFNPSALDQDQEYGTFEEGSVG